jgi:hypothetical protein
MDNEIKITADIVDYLGKYEDGVLVLLSIGYKEVYTEGTLYYSDKMLALTVDESIENDLGSPIELWSGYKDFLVSILKRVVPYNEIINRLDDVNFSQYFGDINIESIQGEDIDEDDIITE